MRRAILIVAALLAVTCAIGAAQEITGQIRGTVTDATGAVVPGAKVTITNSERGQVVRETTADSAGAFAAPLLPVATYSVTVEASGFKKFVKTGIVLNVSDRIVVDAALQAGASTESITVEASPLDVNLQSSAVEGVVTGAQERELPLNNRNYEQLVALQPGVSSGAADSLYVGTTNPSGGVNIVPFSINGNRQSQNNWTIDGADNVDHGSNITLLVYPSVDAISEFKISRSNYSPEFGRSASGQINVITRSGTGGFHGGLYEFFRNDVLNANKSFNNHFALPRAVLRYNDFGGTVGGPILKGKTYFFFSEEVRRVTTPVSTTSTLPSSPERQGIFQAPVCTSVDASGNCLTTGTTIDPANINPVSQAYLTDVINRLPQPDSSGLLASQSAGVFNYREELLRVDHLVNSKIALAGRIIIDHIPTVEPFGLFGPQSNAPGVANTKTDSPGRQYMGRATFQINNHMYNEAGYAYSYGAIVSDPTGTLFSKRSTNVAGAVKLPYAQQLSRIPNLIFDDGFDSFCGFRPVPRFQLQPQCVRQLQLDSWQPRHEVRLQRQLL